MAILVNPLRNYLLAGGGGGSNLVFNVSADSFTGHPRKGGGSSREALEHEEVQ